MSEVQSLIESAVRGDREDLRTLLQQFALEHIQTHQVTGTNWVNPTSGVQKPSTTPPPAATATAAGANGVISLQITNPSQASKATIYHEVSYSTVKNFSQGVTTLPTSAANTVSIPAPGLAPFIRIRSSYDGSTWNTHQLIQQSAVDAGLQTSAASEPGTVLNNWNYANVSAAGANGEIPVIQVYGGNGPYSGYTAGRGVNQHSRPSATILNADFSESQIVGFDGKRFQISSTLPPVLHDNYEPVGLAVVNGPVGGGGISGGEWSEVDCDMSWDLKDHDFDHQTGVHYVVIHDKATGAEHHMRIHVSHETCPTCGHVIPKTNTGQLDFKAFLKAELANAEKAHAQGKKYAQDNNVPPAKKAR